MTERLLAEAEPDKRAPQRTPGAFMPSVGELIVESLAAHGLDRIFCVPGESYLGLLDALHGRAGIDLVVCRHEAGAGLMALADARLTGRPGVACVSRGPGASNAAIAVHTAQQDAVPFILLIGQVAAQDLRRGSFQEIDYGRMFGGIAKWVAEVADPARAPETMLRALQVATTGLPGPVVIALPEDVLEARLSAEPVRPQAVVRAAAHPDDAAMLRQWLGAAERPLVLAGSSLEGAGGREALRAFAESWQVPLVVSFRRQDLFPNAHPLYAGDMGLSNPASQMALLREADLLLVLGARLSDITTQGWAYPRLVRPEMRLVHVHPDPSVIGTHFAADLAMACDPQHLVATLGTPGPQPDRAAWIDRLKSEQRRIAAPRSFAVADGVPFESVVDLVGRHLPADAIVTVDAGTFGAPVYRVVPFAPPQRLLAPISGAMGFGVPAAAAAALRHPERPVVCFVGDGGFAMTGSELALCRERNLPVKVILSENRSYASIRIQQERHYPGRVVGTDFANPDLEAVGRAFGFETTRIGTLAELAGLPAILGRKGPQFVIVETSLAAVLP
jgi:acetolactate synthase-1/2/3 large subunit